MPERTEEELLKLNQLWRDLFSKFNVLVDFLQMMSDVDPDELPDFEGQIRNAKLEMERVGVLLNALFTVPEPPFPSSDEIDKLRDAVGELQKAVSKSAKANVLIKAVTKVVQTWPVSDGG